MPRKEIVTFVNGVKITQGSYYAPRKNERTFDIDKSKYTVWTQGRTGASLGVRGVFSTAEKV